LTAPPSGATGAAYPSSPKMSVAKARTA
jgi:hypothetical protein